MKRLTYSQQKEALTNSLVSFKLDKYFIQNSDARLGKRFAIASKGEGGTIHIHTDFMTYSEMNSFFNGYNKALNNPL